MDKLLLHPLYFGPISYFIALINAEEIVFEQEDNYQKQTYRNRTYVYGANGKLSLNIPIKHSGDKTGHQKYKNVRIENDFPWQKEHWKSLQTAYRTSPFFEFYEDDFYSLYHKKEKFLMEYNFKCLDIILEILQIEISREKSSEYLLQPEGMVDGRKLVEAKNVKTQDLDPYPQVFQEKHGFINDLSILDLLFNEGPNAINYMKRSSPLVL